MLKNLFFLCLVVRSVFIKLYIKGVVRLIGQINVVCDYFLVPNKILYGITTKGYTKEIFCRTYRAK